MISMRSIIYILILIVFEKGTDISELETRSKFYNDVISMRHIWRYQSKNSLSLPLYK